MAGHSRPPGNYRNGGSPVERITAGTSQRAARMSRLPFIFKQKPSVQGKSENTRVRTIVRRLRGRRWSRALDSVLGDLLRAGHLAGQAGIEPHRLREIGGHIVHLAQIGVRPAASQIAPGASRVQRDCFREFTHGELIETHQVGSLRAVVTGIEVLRVEFERRFRVRDRGHDIAQRWPAQPRRGH